LVLEGLWCGLSVAQRGVEGFPVRGLPNSGMSLVARVSRFLVLSALPKASVRADPAGRLLGREGAGHGGVASALCGD
jgi:hypothetical protein